MAMHQHNQPTTKRRSTNTPINSKQNLTSKTTRKQAGNLDYKTRSRHGHNNIAPNQQKQARRTGHKPNNQHRRKQAVQEKTTTSYPHHRWKQARRTK
ncbi:hypothetical protein Peur_038148 [Populus x canadensis]